MTKRISIAVGLLLGLLTGVGCDRVEVDDAFKQKIIRTRLQIAEDQLVNAQRRAWEAVVVFDSVDSFKTQAQWVDSLLGVCFQIPWQDLDHIPDADETQFLLSYRAALFEMLDYEAVDSSWLKHLDEHWQNGEAATYFYDLTMEAIGDQLFIPDFFEWSFFEADNRVMAANQPIEMPVLMRLDEGDVISAQQAAKPLFVLLHGNDTLPMSYQPMVGGWWLSHPGLPTGTYRVAFQGWGDTTVWYRESEYQLPEMLSYQTITVTDE